MSKKYVIYVRRSSDEMSGKQIQSIPDQIWHCLEFAKKEGLEIEQKPKDFSDFETEADIFKEDTTNEIADKQLYQETRHLFIVKESHSGKEPGKRKKRNKIVQMIQSGKIEGLISYSPDRQARNMLEGGQIIELADKDKVDLKYKTFHFENNASGRMMLGFWFVFSKQYSDKLSEDIGRGNEKKVKDGKSLGDWKYGYIRDENGYYKPDNETFEYVQQAFYMKIYEQKSDLYIANWLNEHGVTRTTKKGEKKKVSNKMLGGRWRSEFYYGMYIRGGNTKDLREQEGFIPMITEEEFQILENQLGTVRRNTANKVKEKYEVITPFSPGKVLSEDGYKFSVYLANPARFEKLLKELQKTDKNATLANVVKTYQVRCRCSPVQSKISGLEITYDVIEKVIIEKLKKLEMSEEAYMHYLKKARIKISKLIEENKNKIQKVTLRINRLRSEKEEYIKRNMGIATDEEEKKIYEKEKNKLNTMIVIATKEIETINSNERDMEVEFESFIKLLQQAPELFRKKSYKAKAILTDIFIEKIIITGNKEVILQLKPGIEKFFQNKKPLGDNTNSQNGSDVRGVNSNENTPSNIQKGPDNPVKNKVISIFQTMTSYLVANFADISNDLLEYIKTIDRKQGKIIVRGYIELFGYPEAFDKKLSKQQKILYEIDKK